MGTKYEVRYWDYIHNTEVTAEHTNSLFRALRLLHKLEKEWYCVSIKFRRDKVRQ
jgi:hypothetical protein